MLKDKKGFVITGAITITALLVFGIIFIVLGIATWKTTLEPFLQNYLLKALVGFAWVIASLIIYKAPGDFNKKMIWFVVFTAVGLLAFFFQDLSPGFMSVTGSNYVIAPTFGWYSCEPGTSLKSSEWTQVPKDGSWFACPSNSDKCDFELTINTVPKDVLGVTCPSRVVYEVCDINKQNCVGSKYVTAQGKDYASIINGYKITNIAPNKLVWVQYQSSCFISWKNFQGLNLRYNYVPFVLWKTDALQGGKYVYQEKCVLPSPDCNKMLTATSISSLKPSYVSSCTLKPYETYNYIGKWVATAFSTETYNGKEVYCTQLAGSTDNKRSLVEVETIKTKDGSSYKVVKSSWNTDIVARVDCCENEQTKTQICRNHKWVTIETAECGLLKPCQGSEWTTDPEGKAQKVRYICTSGKCVKESLAVQCTNDNHCTIPGQICVNFKCVQGSIPPEPIVAPACSKDDDCKALGTSYVCVGGKCIFKEIIQNDKQKCLDKGWTWIPEKIIKSCGMNPLCWTGLADPKDTTTVPGYCKNPYLILYIIGGLGGILALALIATYSFKKKTKPKKRGK